MALTKKQVNKVANYIDKLSKVYCGEMNETAIKILELMIICEEVQFLMMDFSNLNSLPLHK